MPWRNEILKNQSQRKADDLWRDRRVVQSAPHRTIEVDGKSYLNFCSNNYLSLASHPELIAAAETAAQHFGTSTTASHLIVGHTRVHQILEEKIAQFVGAEKALLFSTGYMANLAIPTTFLRRNDLLIQDRLNHASIIDSAKLSPAKLRRYGHLDAAAAEQRLSQPYGESTNSQQSQQTPQRKMLITDGVFSMDGDIAPLDALHHACNTHSALLVVDDAHGFGVVGQSGRGTLNQFHLGPTGHTLMMGTLSKSVGSFGAFVAGDAVYIDNLIQHARPFIYTTALPASAAAAALKGIELFQSEPWRREKLHANVAYFRKQAAQYSIGLTHSTTPIQPIIIGDNQATLKRSVQLQQQGLLVVAVRPPTVADGEARLRVTLMTDHTHADIDRLIDALK